MPTNFPRRPSQNEDPWYSARETYDRAIENAINSRFTLNRGQLPDGTDLNSLFTMADSGVYRLHQNLTYHNMDAVLSQQAILHVGTAGSTQYQLIIHLDSFWWRVRPVSSWGNWREVVSTEKLNSPTRLTSNDDLDALTPGEYRVIYASDAANLGLPRRVGRFSVIEITPTINLQKFETNLGDTGPGYAPYEVWVRGMDVDRNYYPEFTKVVGGEDAEGVSNVSHTIVASRASSNYTNSLKFYDKNGDTLDRPASTTKLLTVYIARQTVTNARLNNTVTVLSSDPTPGGSGSGIPLQVGDVLTFRDLFYLTMLPSHNQAAFILARAAGDLISGSGNGYDRFIEKMNYDVRQWGYEGATFNNPSGSGNQNQITTNQLVDLMYRASSDSFLVDVMGTSRWSVDITGPNERTITANHTMDPNGPVKFPDMIAAKTGTLGSHTCLVMLWRKSNGTMGASALMGSNAANRFLDMRQMINYTKEAPDDQYRVGGASFKNRGQLPDETDLDDVHGDQWNGFWRVIRDQNHKGLPKEPSQGSVLEVISPGTSRNSTKQVYTDMSESFWREANGAQAGGVTTWGPWRKYDST